MTVARSFVFLALIACALLVSARPAVAATAEQRRVAWNERLTEEKRAEDAIEDAVTSAMEREPSPYDSHPKPVDRVRWVRELATSVAPAEDDGQDVWSLFASREEIEQVMTNAVRAHLAEQGVLVRSEAA